MVRGVARQYSGCADGNGTPKDADNPHPGIEVEGKAKHLSGKQPSGEAK
ncbi:MAG: hypothetical protein ABW166_21120 [Sedimenticola sp.]